jgi:short subunit dehydrogenase-like uncharacterized protein
MPPKSNYRAYSVIVFGATGFTGQLVANYLAQKYSKQHKFALAGRDEKKLAKIQAEVESKYQYKPDILAFSSLEDEKSIDSVISQGSVIINTTGPFALYGEPVVRSCVKLGTDYVDITGESFWVKEMIDKYHETAIKNHVLIVSMCGFDSLPSDLGNYLAVKALREQYNTATKHVQAFVKIIGGVSGGTLHTMLNALESDGSKEALRDQFLLTPEPYKAQLIAQKKSENRDQLFPAYYKQVSSWTIPFVMAGINTRVVRRSAGLYESVGKGYGKSWSYNEASLVTKRFTFFTSIIAWFFLVVGLFLLAFPPTRKLAKKILPAPGQGTAETNRISAV